MISTPEEIIDGSTSLTITQTTVKKPSAIKSLSLLTNIFYVKKRHAIHHVGAARSKHRDIKAGCSLWKNNKQLKGHSKINDQIKRKLYTWITRHPQVVE